MQVFVTSKVTKRAIKFESSTVHAGCKSANQSAKFRRKPAGPWWSDDTMSAPAPSLQPRPLRRFTASVRADGEVTNFKSLTKGPAALDPEVLAWKRHKKKCQIREKEKTVADLIDEIAVNFNKPKKQKVLDEFQRLQQASRKIVGNDVPLETVDAASVFLFNVFLRDQAWSRGHAEEIKRTLGPFPASAASDACNAVKQILSLLPDDWEYKADGGFVGQPSSAVKEFGHNIVFKHAEPQTRATQRDVASSSGYDSLSDDEFGAPKSDLISGLLHGTDPSSSSVSGPTEGGATRVTVPSSGGSKFTGEWLKQQCQSYSSGGLEWRDVYSAVFDLLSSCKENSGIENNLAELLGFSALDLIQELLANRQEIVHSMLQDSRDLLKPSTTSKVRAAVSSGIHSSGQARPALGSQIIIQSAEEKQLKKLVRKEEKRMAKQVKGLEAAGIEDHETQLQLLGYDPELMRKQRELSLEEASRRPLLTGRRVYQIDPSELYPHVYDSLAKATLTSAFIADSKVSIPEDAQRKNDPVKEEIVIPHTSTAPPPVGEDRVRISELDDIAQIAFRGTKSLNRIQSVVFDAAYYSNENLLISAPTGAGKTNIAMLTVLHEIKNNIGEDGVIKRDNFKIIYVAPMKALAAEMVRNFGSRLSPLGVSVRELTGDMQLTKAEIHKTQMIVTTPEKWDVVTRKATGDVQLAQIVRLLIIDEVHLLHEDRGAVIECLVARTLRQVESSQSMIRIVGLSATLPNYVDVANFLRVNLHQGLFFFDGRFRPVPLSQTFIGVKNPNRIRQLRDMDEVCYDKVLVNIKSGYQVMVFVHARNATVKTATALRDLAASYGDLAFFLPEQTAQLGQAQKQVERSRNKPVRDLFKDGFSTHHAGMLRPDRNLVERLFSDGLIKVLVCTATLAWGINLPAHAVIIKGTQIYDSKKGSFVDIGILDVLQIFGRAGRPQFDQFGEGTIITSHDKLCHYLSLLTRQQPIESQLVASLYDNLNAEISLGTVTNVEEAVQWLSYTYLFIRMKANPLVYGIPHDYCSSDPQLKQYRMKLIVNAAQKLDKAKMIRFVEHIGALHATDLGRTASHYYINYASIETFNELLKSRMTEDRVLGMVSKSDEFEQLKVREDESSELGALYGNCYLPVKEGADSSHGKVNILLQAFISREVLDSFSLTSDLSYVAKNAGRIMRGLFEISLKRNLPAVTYCMLTMCKCVDHRQWGFEHPLRQLSGNRLTPDILNKLEGKKASLARLKDMSEDEIGHLVSHVRMGREVQKLVNAFPSLQLAASIQPITRTVLKVSLTITPDFEWNDKLHGSTSEPWWIWVEDAENNHMYHSEHFLLQKKQVLTKEPQNLVFTIPIFEPLPPQYFVRVVSDRWLHAEAVVAISFKHLILPELHPPHTKLLDLHPLPITALNNPDFEQLYTFPYFNPVQTQIFHTLYHSDNNVLVGAPTGSGKTVAAELAIFRMFNHYPGGKAVYIAPLKALVRERIQDWKIRLERRLHRRVVELTGDTSPDIRAIEKADVIVTTPEKWDGISRSWQNRKYVQAMRLLVIDEIHLLGDERGPVLEVIVSRTNFIASHTEQKVRVVGLSTALANAKDLADWLTIKPGGLFNFHPAVRPVQLEVHIEGFPGRHYCPRMATMNKPAFAAIQTYSPDKPVLIFVSSRRQTRLTAFDLVAFLGARDNPKQWLHLQEHEMDGLLERVSDPNLRFSLGFGIGLHHAGLGDRDRKVVEELFVNQKIHVLIATSTLAWGVNFPAHLVIVKGTEYFDGKTQRYVDYPITDVLQMMGRAGRPQFDDRGVAVILVHDIKKHYYKKFLYEPFPVESNLLEVLADHMNAEIVAGTITSKQDAMDYVTWTYFFRRLVMNPSYYQLQETNSAAINRFLSDVVTNALNELQNSYCIEIEEDDHTVHPLTLGCISSYYYLHHTTVRLFREKLSADSTFGEVLLLLCASSEYHELPVRHNEDGLNRTLSASLPLPVDPPESFDSPHSKTHLLLQAHFSRAELPIADYVTDTKSVLDQALRILQAMVDICADEGWLCTTLRVMHVVQMCVQGRWLSDPSVLTLPHFTASRLSSLKQALEKSPLRRTCDIDGCSTLPELIVLHRRDVRLVTSEILKVVQSESQTKEITAVLEKLPMLSVKWRVKREAGYSVCVMPTSVRERVWTDIEASSQEECIVQVELSRKLAGTRKVDSKALCSRFSKAKDEGWWILLGEVDCGELLALKRVGYFSERTRVSLAFTVPCHSCRKIYSVYVISDCYLGLDQQFELHLNFTVAHNGL